MNYEYIDIDGAVVKKDTIVGVTKITVDGDMMFSFNPHNWFKFYVKFSDGTQIEYYEMFRVKLFSNKPKSEIEKQKAYNKIVGTRNEILRLINFTEN